MHYVRWWWLSRQEAARGALIYVIQGAGSLHLPASALLHSLEREIINITSYVLHVDAAALKQQYRGIMMVSIIL